MLGFMDVITLILLQETIREHMSAAQFILNMAT